MTCVLLLASLLVGGCTEEPAEPPAPPVRAPVEPGPVMPPVPAAPAGEVEVQPLRAVAVVGGGGSCLQRFTSAFASATGARIEYAAAAEHGALRMVASGAADILCICRHKLAYEFEDELVFEPVAWDALVVLVHEDNAVDEITSADLARLLVGRITNWEELGGWNEMVHVVARPHDDAGVERMVRELLFADGALPFAAARRLWPGEDVVAAVAADPEAVALGCATDVRRPEIKLLRIDGMQPTRVSLRVGGYPLMTPVYVAFRRGDARAAAFVEFCRGEGQRSIADLGAVGLEEGAPLWAPYRQRMRAAHVRIGR